MHVKQFKASYLHKGSTQSIMLGTDNISKALSYAQALKENVVKIEEIQTDNCREEFYIEKVEIRQLKKGSNKDE